MHAPVVISVNRVYVWGGVLARILLAIAMRLHLVLALVLQTTANAVYMFHKCQRLKILKGPI